MVSMRPYAIHGVRRVSTRPYAINSVRWVSTRPYDTHGVRRVFTRPYAIHGVCSSAHTREQPQMSVLRLEKWMWPTKSGMSAN